MDIAASQLGTKDKKQLNYTSDKMSFVLDRPCQFTETETDTSSEHSNTYSDLLWNVPKAELVHIVWYQV